MNFIYIILWVSIIVLLYILFHVYKNSNNTINENYLKNSISPIPLNTLYKYQSKSYAYEIWINVNNLTNTTTYSQNALVGSTYPNGNIFNITNVLSLDMYNNGSLYVSIYDGSSYNKKYQVTQNIELQRWQQVIISVDNMTLDIYLNGKLISSSNVTVPTPVSSANISFGTPDVYIAKFNRLDGAMDTNKAWKRYMEGNAGLIPMHVDLTLLNNSISSKFPIL
jgi:hypothetical protein